MTVTKNVNEIVVGATGTIRVAPVGTTAPVDIASSFSGSWLDLGFASEDGVTITESRTLSMVDVWQSFYAARRTVTGRNLRAQFVLRQWNEVTVPLAFGGGSVATTAGPPAYYTYTPPSPETIDERALSVEWVDGTKTYRLIIPRGIVTADVATKITKAGPADLPITFEITGQDGSNPWSLITNDPAFAAG